MLSIIAGLQRATLRRRASSTASEVDEPGADRAVVFQSPCLLPWLTARENVAARASTQRAGARRGASATRGASTISSWSASPTRPTSCRRSSRSARSSACRWRARCRVEPRFLLLDEPFSHARFADALRAAGHRCCASGSSQRKTVVMVTHDVDEALYLADRLILMTDGPAARSATFSRCRSRGRASAWRSWSTRSTTSSTAASSISSRISPGNQHRPRNSIPPAARGAKKPLHSRMRDERRRPKQRVVRIEVVDVFGA